MSMNVQRTPRTIQGHNAPPEVARARAAARTGQVDGDRYEGTRSDPQSAPAESKQNPIAAFFSSIFKGIAAFFRSLFGGGSAEASERPADNEQPAGTTPQQGSPRGTPRTATGPQPPPPNGQARSAGVRQSERPRPVTGTLSPGQLNTSGTRWDMAHRTQPDGTSCIPTSIAMIESVGGHDGANRVGNGEATTLDGAMLQRVLTQLGTSPIRTGVRSRNSPGGSNRGSENGHVLAIDGYRFVNSNGSEASSGAVQRALSAANGDWNQVLPQLANAGITLQFTTQDPGRRTGALGATSHLNVNPDGLVQRPALANDGKVSTGHYTVRYFMLD